MVSCKISSFFLPVRSNSQAQSTFSTVLVAAHSINPTAEDTSILP